MITGYDEDAEDGIREFFAAVTEYKLKCLDIIKKYYGPDFVIYHDDWGTAKMQSSRRFAGKIKGDQGTACCIMK